VTAAACCSIQGVTDVAGRPSTAGPQQGGGRAERGRGEVPLDLAVPAREDRDAVGRVRPCTRVHTRFAVVLAGQQYVAVELDGCLRLVSEDGTLRQGSRQLAALLAAF
jgi:hypothetical protein